MSSLAMMDSNLRLPVHLKLCCVCFLFCATTAWAELAITVTGAALPRTTEFSQLPVTIVIDDVLPSDYDKKEQEADVWQRLLLTLPDSEDDELPLHDAFDRQNEQGYHPHYWYEAGQRTKRTNDNGNYTVTWQLTLKARGDNKLSELLQGTPPALRLTVSYHQWEGDQYGDALLEQTQAFPRLDGVPAVAPQQLALTPRHHRLHIDWQTQETITYSNEQGEFPPAGVLAIVAAPHAEPIDMTAAAMLFRTAAQGGDKPLDTGTCHLLPDCKLDCDDNIYFDFEKIKNIKGLEKSKILQGGTGVIQDLQPDKTYRVMLQYYPDGIKRSQCLTAVPVENKTLLELNGMDDAKREDQHCFIATAAWGTSRAVNDLRWWRDNFLLTHSWGQALTAFYYQYSPPIAALIAEHDWLRAVTRILLLVPLTFVLMCKYPLAICLFLLLLLLLPIHRKRLA